MEETPHPAVTEATRIMNAHAKEPALIAQAAEQIAYTPRLRFISKDMQPSPFSGPSEQEVRGHEDQLLGLYRKIVGQVSEAVPGLTPADYAQAVGVTNGQAEAMEFYLKTLGQGPGFLMTRYKMLVEKDLHATITPLPVKELTPDDARDLLNEYGFAYQQSLLINDPQGIAEIQEQLPNKVAYRKGQFAGRAHMLKSLLQTIGQGDKLEVIEQQGREAFATSPADVVKNIGQTWAERVGTLEMPEELADQVPEQTSFSRN